MQGDHCWLEYYDREVEVMRQRRAKGVEMVISDAKEKLSDEMFTTKRRPN